MLIHIAADDTQSFLERVYQDDVQPNAVDLRLGNVYENNYSEDNTFVLSEESKTHRPKQQLFPGRS